MKKRLLTALAIVGALTVGSFAADLLTTLKSTNYVATDRVGYQTWNILRSDILALNTMFKTGTGSPEGVETATVGAIRRQTDGGDGTALAYKATGSGNTGWVFPTTAASTNTLTNKTLNAESTGNVLTLPFTWGMGFVSENGGCYFPGWNNKTGEGPTSSCVEGTNSTFGTADFTEGSVQNLQNSFVLPSDWTGTVDLNLVWLSTATSGNVVWQFQTSCIAVGEAVDAAWNTASTVTDATQGSSSRLNTAAIVGVTMTGCAAGEMFYFKLLRDPAHASDTLGATARLLYVAITYRRAI